MSNLKITVTAKDNSTRIFNEIEGKFKKSAESIKNIFNNLQTNLEKTFNVHNISMQRLTGSVAKYLVDVGNKVEVWGNQLSIISDSAEEAEKALEAIREFGRTSPLETEDVIQSYIKLRAIGINPTLETMKKIGGVALLMGRQMQDVLHGLIGMNKRTLREYGIEIDRTGSMAIIKSGNIKKVVKKDDASIRKAIIETWGERFPDALEKASNTFRSKMAVVRSNIFEIAATVASAFMPEIKAFAAKLNTQLDVIRDKVIENKEKIVDFVKKAYNAFVKFYEIIVKIAKFIKNNWEIFALAGAAVAIVKVSTAVYGLATAFGALSVAIMTNPIGIIAVAIAGLGIVAIKTAKQWEEWKKNLSENLEIQNTTNQIKYLTELTTLYGRELYATGEAYDELTRKKMERGQIDAIAKLTERDIARIRELETNLADLGSALEGGTERKFERANMLLREAEERLLKIKGLEGLEVPGKITGLATKNFYGQEGSEDDDDKELKKLQQAILKERNELYKHYEKAKIQAVEESFEKQKAITEKYYNDLNSRAWKAYEKQYITFQEFANMADAFALAKETKLNDIYTKQQEKLDEIYTKQREKVRDAEEFLKEISLNAIQDESERETQIIIDKYKKQLQELKDFLDQKLISVEQYKQAEKNILLGLDREINLSEKTESTKTFQHKLKYAQSYQNASIRLNNAMMDIIRENMIEQGKNAAKQKRILRAIAIADAAGAAVKGVYTVWQSSESYIEGIIASAAVIAEIAALTMSQIRQINAASFRGGTEDFYGGIAQVHKDELLNLPRGTQIISQGESRGMMRSQSVENNTQNDSSINIDKLIMQSDSRTMLDMMSELIRSNRAGKFIRYLNTALTRYR